jgi:hypothetical protein
MTTDQKVGGSSAALAARHPHPHQCHSVLMATPTHEAWLAVLIDADNASAQHLERLLVEIEKADLVMAELQKALNG